MSRSRPQFCDWCGEPLGTFARNGEPESCGAAECNRYVREHYRQVDEEARERAQDDDYGRYKS